MHKVVRKHEASVREIAPTYHVRNYITKNILTNISLAINTASQHTETETTGYDRIYYVISGQLNITIDNEYLELGPGDSVVISKGSQYQFGGTFEAVVINQPAFGT